VEAVFSLQFAPKSYKQDNILPVETEELNYSQNLETVELGYESRKTQNQEWLCWQGPSAIYFTDLSEF
jgi:hypothetical protein